MYFGYRTDEPPWFAILDRFLEAGGTFLDTANNYGQWHGDAGESERVIGRWRRSRGVGDQVVLATQGGGGALRGHAGPVCGALAVGSGVRAADACGGREGLGTGTPRPWA